MKSKKQSKVEIYFKRISKERKTNMNLHDQYKLKKERVKSLIDNGEKTIS